MNKKENQKLSDIVTDKDIIKEAAVLGAKDQDNMTKETNKEIEDVVEKFQEHFPSSCQDVESFGDGHYCRHHPDNPEHGDWCYSFITHTGMDIWLRKTLTSLVQKANDDGYKRGLVRTVHKNACDILVKKAKEEEKARIGKQAEYIMEKAKCLTSNDCGLCLRGLQRKCDTAHTVALEHIFSTLTKK